MLEFDLSALRVHPLKFRSLIPAAIVAFGGPIASQYLLQVQWKRSSGAAEERDELLIRWDIAALKSDLPHIENDIDILVRRDEDLARRTEEAAVIVAVAVMSNIEPETRFTWRSRIGTSHDYYLNEPRGDEMIEIAGRSEAGLPGLFEEKRKQSERNLSPRKRWVSVTVFGGTPRNRTEGLHP